MSYTDLQRELQEIDAEISEQEQLQDKAARDLVQNDIAPIESVFKARLTQIAAKLSGLRAKRDKRAAELESAAFEDTISRARQDEVTALQEAYNELQQQEANERQAYQALCKEQAEELRTFLEAQRERRNAAAEPLRAVKQQKNEIYRELRVNHDVVLGGWPNGNESVTYGDLVSVFRKLFQDDVDRFTA